MQRETTIVGVIALLIGVPVTWFVLNALFDTINAGLSGTEAFVIAWWHLLIPVSIVLFAAWLCTTAGAYRGAKRKPVDILRQFAG